MGYGAYIIFAKVSDSLPRYFSETGYIRILCVSVGCEQCNHYNQNMKPFYSIFSEKLIFKMRYLTTVAYILMLHMTVWE